MQLWHVVLLLGLYSITSAMFFPVSQSMVFWKVCLENELESGVAREDCDNRTASSSNQLLQTKANQIFLSGSIAMTVSATFSATLLGKLGDERSRKLAMLVPLVGLLLADALLLLLATFEHVPAQTYVLSELVFGCCGGYVTILSSCFAYGSHLAKIRGRERSQTMAVLEGAIGTGSVIGFLCTSVIRRVGYTVAYGAMTLLHVACILLLLCMTDIRPTREELNSKQKAFLRRLSDKLTSWTTFFAAGENRKRIVILILAFSLSFFSFIGTVHILFYYLKQRFAWDMTQYAVLKAPHQLLSTIAVLAIFPYLKRRKVSDPILALLGLVSRCLGQLWLAVCWNSISVFTLIPLDSLSRFAPTAIRSMLSKTVAENEQGQVFSLISVVELTCTLLASIVFHTLFPYSISFFPQLSFVLMGVIVLPPICLIAYHREVLVPHSEAKVVLEPLNRQNTPSNE